MVLLKTRCLVVRIAADLKRSSYSSKFLSDGEQLHSVFDPRPHRGHSHIAAATESVDPYFSENEITCIIAKHNMVDNRCDVVLNDMQKMKTSKNKISLFLMDSHDIFKADQPAVTVLTASPTRMSIAHDAFNTTHPRRV